MYGNPHPTCWSLRRAASPSNASLSRTEAGDDDWPRRVRCEDWLCPASPRFLKRLTACGGRGSSLMPRMEPAEMNPTPPRRPHLLPLVRAAECSPTPLDVTWFASALETAEDCRTLLDLVAALGDDRVWRDPVWALGAPRALFAASGGESGHALYLIPSELRRVLTQYSSRLDSRSVVVACMRGKEIQIIFPRPRLGNQRFFPLFWLSKEREFPG